jgi:prophage antirepressor-like protein
MTNLTHFDFQGNTIRVVHEYNELWFASDDIAKILEISDIKGFHDTLKDYEKTYLGFAYSYHDIQYISHSGLARASVNLNPALVEPFLEWIHLTVKTTLVDTYLRNMGMQTTVEDQHVLHEQMAKLDKRIKQTGAESMERLLKNIELSNRIEELNQYGLAEIDSLRPMLFELAASVAQLQEQPQKKPKSMFNFLK